MTENLINRISFYLASGGLFNPELADHLAVRNLLMECREALANVATNDTSQERVDKTSESVHEPVAWMVWGENNVPSLTFTKPSDKYVFDSLYMTPPQRTWVGLTDEEIDQGLLRSDYAFKTAEAWRAGVVFAMTKLKEKNT